MELIEICSAVIYVHFQSEIVTEEIVAVNQHANDMFMYELKWILTDIRMPNIKIECFSLVMKIAHTTEALPYLSTHIEGQENFN